MLTDIHIHFCDPRRLDEFMEFCKRCSISRAGLVSLPDRNRGTFNEGILAALKKAPDRFIGFGCLDHRLSRTESAGAEQVKKLAEAGFRGLKLWLGKPAVEVDFDVRMEDDYITGALKAAGESGMAVLLHLADPPVFWQFKGSTNEAAPGLPGSFAEWIERGCHLFSRFPDVTFIGAHLLFLAGGLEKLQGILKSLPNLLLDTAPGRWNYRVLAENSRKAVTFFETFADRLLLGSDTMFFPASFKAFPPMGLEENSRTLERIHRFLSIKGEEGDKEIDDPYPWPDYNVQSRDPLHRLPCLGLSPETVFKIRSGNGKRFFKGEQG